MYIYIYAYKYVYVWPALPQGWGTVAQDFGHQFLGTLKNCWNFGCCDRSKVHHTFSAFWLWSSVVSVLISVTTDMSPTGDLLVTSIFLGEVSSRACSGALKCCTGMAQSWGQHTLWGNNYIMISIVNDISSCLQCLFSFTFYVLWRRQILAPRQAGQGSCGLMDKALLVAILAHDSAKYGGSNPPRIVTDIFWWLFFIASTYHWEYPSSCNHWVCWWSGLQLSMPCSACG